MYYIKGRERFKYEQINHLWMDVAPWCYTWDGWDCMGLDGIGWDWMGLDRIGWDWVTFRFEPVYRRPKAPRTSRALGSSGREDPSFVQIIN